MTLYEATDFSPFISPGHDSTITDDALMGDLSASGSASGPFPEVSSGAVWSFRVVFDLLTPGTFDLDAQLDSSDDYFFNLGGAAISLSVLDESAGTYQPLYSATTDEF